MIRSLPMLVAAWMCAAAGALASPFGNGWTLEPGGSTVQFSTDVIGAVAQTGRFDGVEGTIDANGSVRVSIPLDRVSSGDDLRDARLRFVLFETFRLPEAVVTAKIESSDLSGLSQRRSKDVVLPVALTLNAVTQTVAAPLDIVLVDEDLVVVSTSAPITLDLADFGLLPGLARLEEVAGVKILPTTQVTLDLFFRRSPVSANDLNIVSLSACAERIEVIEASDQVYFTEGSAELEAKSFPLLDAIAETLVSCDGLELQIEGHTDNRGSEVYNQSLSERRAASVVTYLTVKGIDPARISGIGYGETRPIADNSTKRGRWQNRRIEFAVLGL